jgi:hypothetical protein
MTVRRSQGEVGRAGPSRPRGALGQRALPDSAYCGIADFCSSALGASAGGVEDKIRRGRYRYRVRPRRDVRLFCAAVEQS